MTMADEQKPNELTYAEIKKRLREPIPEKLLSNKPVGRDDSRRTITYVNVTDCKDLLDERVGNGYWDATFVHDNVAGELYICWVKIRIHALDGIFDQDGVGDCSFNRGGFGSASTNAYAQAFRRAAEGHGLARELWRGELSEEQKNSPATTAQIASLHTEIERLGKEELGAAQFYTHGRVELFGDMTQDEAVVAIIEMRKLKTPAKGK